HTPLVVVPPGMTTTVLPDRLLNKPLSMFAANCTDSMEAMLVALPLRIQACSWEVACVWFAGNLRSDPSGLRRDRPFRAMIQPTSDALFRICAPTLLLQKPGVRPFAGALKQ